jgi:glycosyltransferase involved in cell wall biosynthesis
VTDRVGIVVPAHDAGRFLEATLASIERQSLQEWSCVVVDDGSTDDTRAIAEEFAARDARFTVVAQEPAGPCAARNRGRALLVDRVDYLTFMDADDVWFPETLDTLVAASEADPDAIGAHGLGDFVDETGAPMQPGTFAALGRARLGCRGGWPRPTDRIEPTRFEHVVTQSVLFPPGVMIARASAYAVAGEFDERSRYAEDWDMLIRLTRIGHLAYVDDVVLQYRRHDTNVGTSAAVPGAVAFVRSKAYFSPENSDEQRRTVRDAWRASQVIVARDRFRDARRMFRAGSRSVALAQVGRVPFLAVRYLRGRPPRPR